MAYNNGIVTAPITETDIANATRYNSYNIGECVLNGTIVDNSWKKPCCHSETGVLSVAQWREANYGWSLPSGYLHEVLRDIAQRTGNYTWRLNTPTGGDNEPFRYTDFEGYNINSPYPFRLRPAETEYKRYDFFHFSIDDVDELAHLEQWADFGVNSALAIVVNPSTNYSAANNYYMYVIANGATGLTIEDVLTGGELRITPAEMEVLVSQYDTSMRLALILIKDGSSITNYRQGKVASVQGSSLLGVVRTNYDFISLSVSGGGSGDNAQDYVKFSISSISFNNTTGYLSSVTYYCEIISGGGISSVNINTSLNTRLGDTAVTNNRTFTSSGYWTVNYNATIYDDGGAVSASLRCTYTDASVQTFTQALGNIWNY